MMTSAGVPSEYQPSGQNIGGGLRARLAQRLGSHSGLALVGTPETIADAMEEWLVEEQSGFNIMFPFLPQGLAVVDRVVPVLQRRGLFRAEYEGTTLRESRPAETRQPLF